MLQDITENHWTDPAGNPTGGHTQGVGIDIHWQDGPLGRGAERQEPNGAFVEGVIAAALGRIRFYQEASNGRFACNENGQAIDYLTAALKSLDERTAAREAREVEGTHAP